jgi:hypothetical protein
MITTMGGGMVISISIAIRISTLTARISTGIPSGRIIIAPT